MLTQMIFFFFSLFIPGESLDNKVLRNDSGDGQQILETNFGFPESY